jgi:hypothetical protein
MRAIEITPGDTFGRLTILGEAGRAPGERERLVSCRCICGTVITVRLPNLRSGHTRSCGCHRDDVARVRSTKHGNSQSREYTRWSNMKARCSNPKIRNYHRYGGRGITVCPEWADSFEQFLADMGPCPDGLTLERRDNDQGYSAENCVWASRTEQANNTRANQLMTFDGRTLSVEAWSREYGLPRGCLHNRLFRYHWPLEKALTAPVRLIRRPSRPAHR